MDVLSDRTLDSLRLDFESLEEDIAALGARIERIKRPERYATDFDFHLLVMQYTAMENLRNVLGMRLVREYWKKFDGATGGVGAKGVAARTMKTLVKSAKSGFRESRRNNGWGGTNGDREEPPPMFRPDPAASRNGLEDRCEDEAKEEAEFQEELKQLKELCDRNGEHVSAADERDKRGRHRQRTRNRNRNGEQKWGVRPKHLAPKKDAAPSAVPQTDTADASGGAVAETKPAVAVPEDVSTTTTTTTETGGSEHE